MLELTFLFNDYEAMEAMVQLDEKTGKILELYVYREDISSHLLSKFRWKQSRNPLFYKAIDPKKVFNQEVKYWFLCTDGESENPLHVTEKTGQKQFLDYYFDSSNTPTRYGNYYHQ